MTIAMWCPAILCAGWLGSWRGPEQQKAPPGTGRGFCGVGCEQVWGSRKLLTEFLEPGEATGSGPAATSKSPRSFRRGAVGVFAVCLVAGTGFEPVTFRL